VQRGKAASSRQGQQGQNGSARRAARVRAADLGTTTSSGRRIQPQGIRRQARSGPDMVACSSLRTANSGRHNGGQSVAPQGHLETGSTNTETFQCRTRSGC